MEGISNLGATCAINSLIQIICRNKHLSATILNANVSPNSFTGELKEIIELICNQNKSLHPAKFIDCFYKTFNGIFNRYEQIDINELWFYVFDKINEETSKPSLLNFSVVSNLKEEHDYKINIYNNNKTSELLKLVQGSFINIIECSNCNHRSYSFEPFINISLDIDTKTDNNLTIADLISTFIKDEFREADAWKCDKCLQNCSYIKTNRIWKIPKVLLLSLNRFKDHNNKNNKEIFINDELNFNKGSVLSINEDCKFELQAVGLHFGGLCGGHYTSACNMNNGNYHHYNDDVINVISSNDIKQILNKNGYLIIYENK